MYNKKMLTNFWEELTTNEIKKINRKTVLIFPFSSIEQHGPHLPLNTDKKILEGILLEFNKKYNSNKYLIMPEIYFGSAAEHTDFDGTISIDSLEFISHSLSILENVCKLKFKNILLLNSHGGQISHIDIIAKELKSEFKINIVKGTYFLFDQFKGIISSKEKDFGYHGGEFETSIMLYLFPNLVRQSKISKHRLSPDYLSSKTISYEKNIKKAWTTKELSKSGIIGDPRKSNSKIGKKIIDRVTQKLNKIINEMF